MYVNFNNNNPQNMGIFYWPVLLQ